MWKLREIVAMVILSVACGGVYRIWDIISPLLVIAWVPAQGFINGMWWIAAGLVPYIVRRPGAALISEIVAALIELAAGGNWGIGGVFSGLLQGLGAEIVFMLFRWRKYNSGVMMLSGAFAGIGFSIQWYVQYNGHAYRIEIVLLYVIATMISGAVLGGLLPKWIADALNRTGVLRNFRIGGKLRQPHDL